MSFQTSAAGGSALAPGSEFELTQRLCLKQSSLLLAQSPAGGKWPTAGDSSTFTQHFCGQRGHGSVS